MRRLKLKKAGVTGRDHGGVEKAQEDDSAQHGKDVILGTLRKALAYDLVHAVTHASQPGRETAKSNRGLKNVDEHINSF